MGIYLTKSSMYTIQYSLVKSYPSLCIQVRQEIINDTSCRPVDVLPWSSFMFTDRCVHLSSTIVIIIIILGNHVNHTTRKSNHTKYVAQKFNHEKYVRITKVQACKTRITKVQTHITKIQSFITKVQTLITKVQVFEYASQKYKHASQKHKSTSTHHKTPSTYHKSSITQNMCAAQTQITHHNSPTHSTKVQSWRKNAKYVAQKFNHTTQKSKHVSQKAKRTAQTSKHTIHAADLK